MEHMKKRGLAALLVLGMALSLLAGCGGKDKDTQQLSATVYVPKYVELGLELDDINDACTDGENLYLIGETYEKTEQTVPGTDETYFSYTYNYDIYRVSLEGGTAEKLPNYTAPTIPEGFEGNCYINSIMVDDDGTLWVTESVDIWGTTSGMYGGYGVDDGFAVSTPAIARSVISYAAPESEEVEADDAEVDTADIVDDFDEKYPEEFDYEYFESMSTNVRKHLSADGTELGSIDIKQLPEKLGVDWIDRTVFGPEGNIYTCVSDEDGAQMLYVLDSDLNIQFSLKMGTDYWGSVTPLGSGKACSMNWFYDEAEEVYGYKVQMIDFEKQDWGAEYLLPSSAYSVFPGGGDYLFYYQLNDAIMGWKDSPDTEVGERLFSWIEADLNSDNIQNFFFLPDGRVAAILREWTGSGEGRNLDISAVIMTATPRSELPEKTTLTFATMYLDYDTRGRIIDFNKTNETYRIEVKDYSEYNTASDSNAGLQKLNTEVIAGVVPDILDTSAIPLKQYAAKGYLEDLWAFIDNDPDLSRDKLMLKPLEADQLGGKLYEVFATFSVQTVIGSSKIVGDRMSWTLADLMDALEKMPDGCAIFGEEDTKDGMLNTIVNMNMGNFVDWDSGKCYFDGENFKSLLAFCNQFAAEFDYDNVDWTEWEDSDTRLLTGKQMLSRAYLGSLDWSIQRYTALFPEGLSYVGYPMEDGSVGSCFSLSSGFAISSTCKDKDGAWSFIRQILLPREDEDRYYYSGFPVNKADFDMMVEKAMVPQYYTDENGDPYLDENGEPIISNLNSIWMNDGTQIDCHLPTQEEVDQFMDLYNAITTVYSYDTNIYEIIRDVTGAYFAGDRNLEDTVSQIQNRVNLYVNESK